MESRANPILIENGTTIDGTGADPIENGAVLIEDGEIAAVGPRSDLEVPTDAHVIDAAGKTVMPGLVEGHAHVGGFASKRQQLRRMRIALQRGITTIASVCSNDDGLVMADAIDAGEARGAARIIKGAMVAPTNGHVRFRDADGPWEVRKAVREMKEMGHDFIKTAASGGFWHEDERCALRNYTYEELEALADEAHAWDMPVVAHAHTQPGINHCIEAGIDQIHHGAFIDEEGVRGILEEDLYFVPTLRVTTDRNLDAWPDRPWMREEMEESQPIHREGTRLAGELGVKVGVGSDFPGSGDAWRIGDTTLTELQELVDCGFSPMEAIRASVEVTPEAFGFDDEIGTLEEGHRADVIVVDGEPHEDVDVLYEPDNVQLVLKDGVVESADDEYIEHYRVKESLERVY